MLAEPRRKLKSSLDPRGKHWSEDSNKLGQKMLEKMGWTSGKGLGANCQGITEHIKGIVKNNKTGIGYDKNNIDQEWKSKHHEKFDEFLQELNDHYNEEIVQRCESSKKDLSRQSSEVKSDRTRLRYSKFTCNKDMNKYSSKDLASIFGQKKISKNQVKKNNDICEEEAINDRDHTSGVIMINSGSMVDYFKHKLPNRENLLSSATGERTINSESETKRYVDLGFTPQIEKTSSRRGISKNTDGRSIYAFDNPCVGLNSSPETQDSIEKKRKEPESINLHINQIDRFHVRQELKTELIAGNCENGFINPTLSLDAEPNENRNGREFEVSRMQFGLENCALDLTDEKDDRKRVTFNDHVEYSIDSAKRKKGKATLDKFEIENKKHRKSQKRENVQIPASNGFVNEALDVETSYREINDNKLNEHKSKTIKKRKVYKMSNLETIQESPEREKEIIDIETELGDIGLNLVGDEITNTMNKESKKKNRKKKKLEANVEDFTERPDVEIKIIRDRKIKTNKSEEEMITSKKRKKEKKKGKEDRGIESIKDIKADISDNQQDVMILESILEQQQNHSIKKKKRKKDDAECLQDKINMCDAEKEVSDKENASKKSDMEDIKKLAKKDIKCKRSKDNSSDKGESFSCDIEMTDVSINMRENIEHTEFTPSKKSKAFDTTNDIIHSPWSEKRMSKKTLKAFFYKNLVADFPGSNIHKIVGYGVNIDTNS